MRSVFAAVLLLLALGGPARAVDPAERLADPALEARARAISRELRCLVCQNESIDESAADLAHDIRVVLRDRIKAGDTDAQAVKFIVDRYGQFVLLKPPVEPATYLLWFGPALLVLVAVFAYWRWLRAQKAQALPPAPLTESEQRRLRELMGGDGA